MAGGTPISNSTFASYRSSGVTGVTGVQTILPTPVN
jgi:hypothetical protein